MSDFVVFYYNRQIHERGMLPDDVFELIRGKDNIYRAYLNGDLVKCERIKSFLTPFVDAEEASKSGKPFSCPCERIMRNRWNQGGTIVQSIIRPDCPFCEGNAIVKWVDEESKGPEEERINTVIDFKPYAKRHALYEAQREYDEALANLENTKKKLQDLNKEYL